MADKKAPGFDFITSKMLKELPNEGIKFINIKFDAVIR